MFTYEYEMMSLSVDMVYFRMQPNYQKEVLLIERGGEPFKGYLALPGGFVERNEKSLQAAIRETKEEINLDIDSKYLQFIGIADAPYRDPRQRTVSCIYACYISNELSEQIKAGDDAVNFKWVNLADINRTTKLAFDHYDIIMKALQYNEYEPIPFAK